MSSKEWTDETVDKACDEAREEGFQEGYAEGQGDANCAATETFNAMLSWMRKRDMLDDADYPEGFTAIDIMDALNEHEENLVSDTKRAYLTATSSAADAREQVLAKALRRLAYFAQTSGGTAGRDEQLVAAIDVAIEALRMHDAARKIITDYDPKPIPVRRFDWSAQREGDDGEDLCGYGATEREAIADLRDREAEAQDEAEARAARKAGAA